MAAGKKQIWVKLWIWRTQKVHWSFSWDNSKLYNWFKCVCLDCLRRWCDMQRLCVGYMGDADCGSVSGWWLLWAASPGPVGLDSGAGWGFTPGEQSMCTRLHWPSPHTLGRGVLHGNMEHQPMCTRLHRPSPHTLGGGGILRGNMEHPPMGHLIHIFKQTHFQHHDYTGQCRKYHATRFDLCTLVSRCTDVHIENRCAATGVQPQPAPESSLGSLNQQSSTHHSFVYF